jgi:O-antigen ligase
MEPDGHADAPIARFLTRAALAIGVLGFVPGLLDPFNAAKVAGLRVLGFAALAAAALAWIQGREGGRSRASRLPASRTDANPLDVIVVAWVAISILATVTGISPRLSWLGEIEQREGLAGTLALAGIYTAARRGHANAAARAVTFAILLASAGLAAIYALAQRAGLDPFAWNDVHRYPRGAALVLRPFATLGNPILLGCVLAPVLAWLTARLASGPEGRWWRAPLAVLLGVALVSTLSRGAWLAAAAGVGAAGVLAWRAWPAERRRVLAALALATLPAAAWGWFDGRGAVWARIAEGSSSGATSQPMRSEIGRSALELWRGSPWLGVGPDAFGLAFPVVQTPGLWRREWIGTPVHAHSAALQILATLGLAGALAGLAWLAALAWGLARGGSAAPGNVRDRVALAAALIAVTAAGAVNAVGPAGATIFTVLSALAAGSAARQGLPAPRRPGAAIAGVALAAALAAGAMAAREFAALRPAGEGRAALEASLGLDGQARVRSVEFALERARRAVELAPGEDELRRLAADAALARVRAGADSALASELAREAESAARASLRLVPRRASNFQRLANALAMRARLERADRTARWEPRAMAAEAAFAEAERRAPFDALILTDHVTADLALGRGEAALAVARRIVALYPEAASGHALEAAAFFATGQPDSARFALRRARAARWEPEDSERKQVVERMLDAMGARDSLP